MSIPTVEVYSEKFGRVIVCNADDAARFASPAPVAAPVAAPADAEAESQTDAPAEAKRGPGRPRKGA